MTFFAILQVIIGVVAVFSTCTCVVMIKVIGKRNLYLISLAGVVVTMTALGEHKFTEYTKKKQTSYSLSCLHLNN